MKEPSDKRQAILATACRLFSRKGFFQTSMRDVAREAGVATGTTYIYFPTKESLLDAIYENSSRLLLERIEVRLAGIDDARARLEAFFAESIEFSFAHPDDFLILFVDLRRSEVEFPQRPVFRGFRRYVELLRAIIDEGHGRGAFSLPASSPLLMGVMGFWVAIVLRALLDPAARDAAAQKAGALQLVQGFLQSGLVGARRAEARP